MTIPVDIASGSEQPVPAAEHSASPGGAADQPASVAPPPVTAPIEPPLDAPDPKPLRSRVQYEFTLLYDSGTVTVERINKREHANAVVTPRNLGRWALELCVGHEVVERLRFDFPLLAGEEPPAKRQPPKQPPRFAPGARVAITISVPDSDRPTFARLVDRQTKKVTILTWPPTPTSVSKKTGGSVESAPGRSPQVAPATGAPPLSPVEGSPPSSPPEPQ